MSKNTKAGVRVSALPKLETFGRPAKAPRLRRAAITAVLSAEMECPFCGQLVAGKGGRFEVELAEMAQEVRCGECGDLFLIPSFSDPLKKAVKHEDD